MSLNTISIFDSNVDKTLDFHGLFHRMCNIYNANNIQIDCRYGKLLLKHNIDLKLIQDYIYNIIVFYQGYSLNIFVRDFFVL